MKDTDDTVVLTMCQKLEAEHAPSNQDTDPLKKGKPANVKTDDWLVALLSSLWHQSCDKSAKTREIVESNVNPEEAETAHGLFLAMPPEPHNQLQKHTVIHLYSLRMVSWDNMRQPCSRSSVLALY